MRKFQDITAPHIEPDVDRGKDYQRLVEQINQQMERFDHEINRALVDGTKNFLDFALWGRGQIIRVDVKFRQPTASGKVMVAVPHQLGVKPRATIVMSKHQHRTVAITPWEIEEPLDHPHTATHVYFEVQTVGTQDDIYYKVLLLP